MAEGIFQAIKRLFVLLFAFAVDEFIINRFVFLYAMFIFSAVHIEMWVLHKCHIYSQRLRIHGIVKMARDAFTTELNTVGRNLSTTINHLLTGGVKS